jgi:hypothetical protein
MHEVRRKEHLVYMFDRSSAKIEFVLHGKILDESNIRMWISFLGLFHILYEINRCLFFTEPFEIHLSHKQVSSTWAFSA